MPRFVLTTAKPLAVDSPDYLCPHGTAHDNSRNPLFNKKLYALFGRTPLAILDFGCSGGGFVKDCLDNGHIAIGLEGSDYSRKAGRAEWSTISDHLFTCDIAAPFSLKASALESGEEPEMKFDVITAWEFIEHIRIEDLHEVCENARRHLRSGGLWVMSVSPNEDVVKGARLHQTVQGAGWWLDYFHAKGFTNHPNLVGYFDRDWVRGPLQGAPNSFHLVLTYGHGQAPEPSLTVPYSGHDLFEAAVAFTEQLGHIDPGYALSLLDEAEQSLGRVEELHYYRALILLHQGRLAEAGSAALAEIELQPRHSGARRILDQVGRVPVAPDASSLLGRTGSHALSDYVCQANRHLTSGDMASARDTLQEALSMAPGNLHLIMAYGGLLLHLNHLEEARRQFAKVTALFPDHAPAHLNLAAVLLLLNRLREAETAVGRALLLNPKDGEARKLLDQIRHV